MIRTLDEDGTLHFSAFKKISKSGVQYLHAVNAERSEPTRDMRIGSAVNLLALGSGPGGRAVIRFDGDTRRGSGWELFRAANATATILTAPEWDEALCIADALIRSPIYMDRMAGARVELPLRWEESGIPCSTSGVDIYTAADRITDLKVTRVAEPEAFQRHAFAMCYAQQLAFYRRGAMANGLRVVDLSILGVEREAPHEVVELVMTDELLDLADKTISIWFEDLRRNMLTCPEPSTVWDWPGYAEAPVRWDVPSWKRAAMSDLEDDGEVAA